MVVTAFAVEYTDVARVDIRNLDTALRERVRKAIEGKLMHQPALYGEHLRGSLKNYWKLRVGAYRGVYRIKGKKVVVATIRHRSVAYSGN